jgi:hypothetical protein
MQNEVTSKRKNGVERTRYNFGAQVKSRAELMKFLQVKREKKAQEDKIEGIKASRNVRGTKATMAEVEGQRSKPKKPSLNAAKIPTNEVEGHNNKQTKRINLPSFSIASYSQEKNSKFATSDESRTKVTKENTQSKGCIQIEDPKSRVTKKVVAAVVNDPPEKWQIHKQPGKRASGHNDSHEEQQGPKKTKRMPGFRPMLIDAFLKQHGVPVEDEEFEIEAEEEDIEREGENALEEEGSVVNGDIGQIGCFYLK